MNYYLKLLTAILCMMGVALTSFGQTPSYLIVEKLPIVEWTKQENAAKLSDEEKLEMLKMLPEGDRVEFIYEEGQTAEETEYLELNVYGLKYLDLDFDGDLDLLYTSLANGGMRQLSTKVYYNKGGKLKYHSTLKNGIIDIHKEGHNYRVYTQFHPCCDSYTTRINQYNFSGKDKAVFVESISLIGRSNTRYKGMPDFSTPKIVHINNPSIYAFPADFIHTSPYFRGKSKEVRTTIRARKKVELIKITGQVEVGILDSVTFKEEDYLLIITEPLNGLAKMPISLYEWSDGDNRRLIGWVKANEIE